MSRRLRPIAFPCNSLLLLLALMSGLNHLAIKPLSAQVLDSAQVPNREITPDPQPPSLEPLPEIEPSSAPLPPLEELLPSPALPPPEVPAPEISPDTPPPTITVERFEVVGSTVFSQGRFDQILAEFTNRSITLAELFQARSAITQLYTEAGYINSGAFIPPQKLEEGVVTIQVVEGELEAINVSGTQRLNRGYVRSRIAVATEKPLNVDQLLEALQLLRLNPLIENISAELSAGTRPGESLLEVQVSEADSFSAQTIADNGRSPSVGSFRRRARLNERNLFGFGDDFDFTYTNTDGSDAFDISYTIPVNPRNGTVRLAYGTTSSEVIEPPFDELDIESESRYYELTLRQPIIQTPTQELALGITASRQESENALLGIPFPLSAGADEEGRTRISALRFFQEWTQRSEREVLAARSQFSLGLGAFDATINDDGQPDSLFFAWRGQGQWVRLLAEDTLLLLRADVQLADQELVPLEQFGIGGIESVRGYRQDILLGDNGVFGSAELRLPILRVSDIDGVLQLTPFIDGGTIWNFEDQGTDQTLLSVGLGLRWQQSDRLTVRLDWGIPLIEVDSRDRTWQENGIYFSIIFTPF